MLPKANLLKKVLFYSAFFYALLFLSVASAANCPPQHIDESVRVNYIYDGDTVQLEDGRKVRLIGIDTPEVFSKHLQLDGDIKAAGESAKSALTSQLKHSNNLVSLAFGPQQFDRYGRTLAHVFLPDGQNLQAWLVSKGYAIAFTTPPNDRMSHCYRKQEKPAIESARGIWQLEAYKLKQTSQLNDMSRGFHRLKGRVTRLWQNNFKVTLFLDELLEVVIYKNDLANFNAHMLNNLQGKEVKLRGWLSKKKNQSKLKYRMTLRHPDAIKVIN